MLLGSMYILQKSGKEEHPPLMLPADLKERMSSPDKNIRRIGGGGPGAVEGSSDAELNIYGSSGDICRGDEAVSSNETAQNNGVSFQIGSRFDYRPRSQRAVPSVRRLQDLLENAWAEGFDSEGATIYGINGVHGNTRWIGM